MKYRFHVCFEPEEGCGYTAYVPAPPGCISYGRTIEETERSIKEVVELYLDGLREHGLPMPESDDSSPHRDGGL